MGSDPRDPQTIESPCGQELPAQVDTPVWHCHLICSASPRRCEKNVLASDRDPSVRPRAEYSHECRQNHSGCASSHQGQPRH